MKTTTPVLVAVAFAVLSTTASAQQLDVKRAKPGTLQQNEAQKSGKPADPSPVIGNPPAPVLDPNAPALDPAARDPLAPIDPLAPVALPPAPAFAGTPRQGLAEIRQLALDGRSAEAAALALALADAAAGDERLCAELRYAGGVAGSIADLPANAALEFRSAGALAGPGDLRLQSLYNESVQSIVQAEALRASILEIEVNDPDKLATAGQNELGTTPDTLPAAREKYLEAKGLLLDLIRIDWRDEDVRANLEFVGRRLDELAEIENKRDEAKNQIQSQGKETEKTEQGQGSTKGQEESEQEQDEDGKQGSDPNSQQESVQDADPTPGEGADEGDDMPNPKAEERKGEEQEKQEPSQTGDQDQDMETQDGGAEHDPEMSAQEARLLLDRINEIDQYAKRLRAALYQTRMVPVARDW